MINRKKLPTQLILVALITLLPLLAGTFLYFNHTLFTLKTLNRGTLVKPVIDVHTMHLSEANKKLWKIVYVNNGTCDHACQTLSYQLTQLTKILNKDRDRTIAIVIKTPSIDLQSKFIQSGLKDFVVENKVYLVDPLGNLFMYYPSTIDPMNILKDMKRVLEVSQIG